jgi:hypothetical protein
MSTVRKTALRRGRTTKLGSTKKSAAMAKGIYSEKRKADKIKRKVKEKFEKKQRDKVKNKDKSKSP